MMSNKQPLWTKDFILISLVNFFLMMVFYLLIVIMGVYAVDVYQATPVQAGLVSGIFILGILLGRLLIGKYVDVLGRKRVLLIGTVLFVLVSLLYFIHSDLNFLVLTRFLHGVAFGFASTAAGTIAAQVIPENRKGEGIGYYSMSSTLSTAIGPFLGLYLGQHMGFNALFLMCLAVGIISLLACLLVKVPKLVSHSINKIQQPKKGFQISNYIEVSVLPIALIALLIGFCYSSVLSYINFYAKELNLVSWASLFFLVYSVAVLVSRPFTGKFMDIKNANYIMYPAFVCFAIGLVTLSLASSGFAFLVSGFLIGLGFGNLQSCSQAISIKIAPSTNIGLATATFFIALEAGLGLGPYLLGYLIPLFGYAQLYFVLAIFCCVVMGIYFLLIGRRRQILNI